MSDQILLYASYLGIFVFAASGALAAAERRLDILGFLFFAVLVGTGGGTVRDVLLDVPVSWIANPVLLWLALSAGVICYFAHQLIAAAEKVLIWFDAVGISFFSVLGCAKAANLGLDPAVCVVMGVLSATFGSILRDVILNREPLILGPDIYVTPTLLACLIYLLWAKLLPGSHWALPVAVAVGFALRAGAILFTWRLPRRGLLGEHHSDN